MEVIPTMKVAQGNQLERIISQIPHGPEISWLVFCGNISHSHLQKGEDKFQHQMYFYSEHKCKISEIFMFIFSFLLALIFTTSLPIPLFFLLKL